MKSSKRILSLLLAVMMVLAIAPVYNAVNAVNEHTETDNWTASNEALSLAEGQLVVTNTSKISYSLLYNGSENWTNYEFEMRITGSSSNVNRYEFYLGNVFVNFSRGSSGNGRTINIKVGEEAKVQTQAITWCAEFVVKAVVEEGVLTFTYTPNEGEAYTYTVDSGVTAAGGVGPGFKPSKAGETSSTVNFEYINIKEITGEVCNHVFANGVCTECGEQDPDAAYEAIIGEDKYETFAAALAAVQSGETVLLKKNVTASMVNVPSGVTLNLNGNVLTTDILLGFGTVMDQNTAGVDGKGGLVIGSAADTLVYLQETNPYLPVYDSTNGVYKFFGYNLVSKETNDDTVHAVAIQFPNNVEAYDLISKSNAGLNLAFNLDLGDGTMFQMPYSNAGIKAWAAEAYTYYSNPENTKDMTLTMTVTGAPAGATMTVALGAAFGVSSAV